MAEHLQPSRDPSLVQRSMTRNSHYSHRPPSINATTRSWVHSQQNTPGHPPSPPLPISLPTPVQRLRPLPNPHAQQYRPPVLYTVNPSESLDSVEDQQRINNIRLGLQKAGPSKLRKPPATIHNFVDNTEDKKPTILGGLVKSIRRIPKIIGYAAGKGSASKRNGALEAEGEGTSPSVTGITSGCTLPQYTSNPPTPVVAPIPSRPHHYAHQPTGMQIQTTAFSPPPEVVRIDDVRRRRPDFRIMPPSINIARSETAHFFPGTTNNTDASSSASNTAERTTVMLYNHDHHTPTPTPSLSRQISSNGPPGRLSYVGSEQVVRPTSFHGGSQAPPPIEIPTSTARMGTPVSYLSYVSQPTVLPSTLPLNVKRSPSQLQSQRSNRSNQSQHHQQHQPTSPPQHPSPIESPERIQSPISAHPQPTTDYLKMALSPPHSLQHHTTALDNLTPATHHSSSAITSFSYDPSFSKTSSPMERFFKTLYYMPWIAHERITVDYLPGKVGRVHGHALSRETSVRGVRDERRRKGGDRRRKETRDKYRDRWRRKQRRTRVDRGDGDEKIASWYKGVSSHSKKASAELDLLSSDLGLNSPSTTTGIGASNGLGLEYLPADDSASPTSPLVATVSPAKQRERRQREQNDNVGDKQERSSRSRHHHRQDPQNRHRGKQRRRIGSVGNDETLNQSPSPLIPAVYPFYYPPYPYPYPYTFTSPSPSGPHAQHQSQSHPHPLSPPSETPNDQTHSRKQRSSRSRANQGRPSISHPVFYSPGIPHPGYTAPAHAYQPMIVPSTTAMMAPQVYLLHSTTDGQLQPLSPSGPVHNGSGPEVLLDAVDSGQ